MQSRCQAKKVGPRTIERAVTTAVQMGNLSLQGFSATPRLSRASTLKEIYAALLLAAPAPVPTSPGQ